LFPAKKITLPKALCGEAHCHDVVGYQHLEGPSCLHFHFTLKKEAAWCSKMLVPTTSLHGIRTQKATTGITAALKTSILPFNLSGKKFGLFDKYTDMNVPNFERRMIC
jgi:hypothetical protein